MPTWAPGRNVGQRSANVRHFTRLPDAKLTRFGNVRPTALDAATSAARVSRAPAPPLRVASSSPPAHVLAARPSHATPLRVAEATPIQKAARSSRAHHRAYTLPLALRSAQSGFVAVRRGLWT